jgi:hypothetical protein
METNLPTKDVRHTSMIRSLWADFETMVYISRVVTK